MASPGSRDGRGRRVPRPRQRREQRERGRRVRLPARVGRRARERDGVAHPVPLREARRRDGQQPSRPAREAHPQPPGPLRLLAAGRARGDGDRHRGGDRRRHRAQPALRPAAAARRRHHGLGVDGAARAAQPTRSADLRARRGGARRDHRDRVLRGARRRARRRRRGRWGSRAALHGCRLGAAGRIDPRRDGHAARDLRALRTDARPAST